MKTKKLSLSGGGHVQCFSKSEAAWVYNEVQGYLRHGIHLEPGATVFDVGANIGMFAVYISRLLDNDVQIHSFEPIPPVYELLKANAQGINPEGIHAHCYGLGATSASVEFDFYPAATLLSNSKNDNSEGKGKGKSLAREILVRHPQHTHFPGNALRLVPRSIRGWIFDRLAPSFFAGEVFECSVRPLTDAISENEVTTIDLLKIDVEGAEFDVLQGIASSDWSRIRQMVIEVHDIDGRLERTKSLLSGYGFQRITVEQDALFQNSANFNLFATR